MKWDVLVYNVPMWASIRNHNLSSSEDFPSHFRISDEQVQTLWSLNGEIGPDDTPESIVTDGFIIQPWRWEKDNRYIVAHNPKWDTFLKKIGDEDEINAPTFSLTKKIESQASLIKKKTKRSFWPIIGIAGMLLWDAYIISRFGQKDNTNYTSPSISQRHFEKASHIGIEGFSLTHQFSLLHDTHISSILRDYHITLEYFISLNPHISPDIISSQNIPQSTNIVIPAYLGAYTVQKPQSWNQIVDEINQLEPFKSSTQKLSVEVITTINDTNVSVGDTIIVPTVEQAQIIGKYLDQVSIQSQEYISTGNETVQQILERNHREWALSLLDEFIAFNEGISGINIDSLSHEQVAQYIPPKWIQLNVPIISWNIIDPLDFNSEVKEHDSLVLTAPQSVQNILTEYGVTLENFIQLNPHLSLLVRDVPWDALPSFNIPAGWKINLRDISERIKWPSSTVSYDGMTLEQISHMPYIDHLLEEFDTTLEEMVFAETKLVDGKIVQDIIDNKSDAHQWEQIAGINLNSARNSSNPQKLLHAQEVQKLCLDGSDQELLRKCIKTYYVLYYFPKISSSYSGITRFLLDTSMNRGENSLQPICKIAINNLAGRNYVFSTWSENSVDREGKAFTKFTWNKEWTQEHQNMWDALCSKDPYWLLQALYYAREMYENHEHGPRESFRKWLINRWNAAREKSHRMLEKEINSSREHSDFSVLEYQWVPCIKKEISYHDAEQLIRDSLKGDIKTHDEQGHRIIYRVQRFLNPKIPWFVKAQENYEKTINRSRNPKKILLYHGTASWFVGSGDNFKRDMGWFNALYSSSDACYGITSAWLVFEFFDPDRWHGAANATRIAESTGVLRETLNINDSTIAVELCLRALPGSSFGVEEPSMSQVDASKDLLIYLQGLFHWKLRVGTSADPVRNRSISTDESGQVKQWPEYLVPKAHSDDFSPFFRRIMGVESAEDMFKFFSHKDLLLSFLQGKNPALVNK